MDLVVHKENTSFDLSFFLAQEEYLARRFKDKDFIFAWQVEPTVIIGRNQLIHKEIDVEFCNANSIKIVRRKSGGGAVLADMNNIMFSYICSSDNVSSTFNRYTGLLCNALRSFGLEAKDTSRNDILIGDRKVSGNSYYHINGRSIVHGTMLYSFDSSLMSKVLRPSAPKLDSHGVSSVKSRVTCIKDHLPQLSLEEFKTGLLNKLTSECSVFELNEGDVAEIRRLEQQYLSPAWLQGKNPKGTLENSKYFPGVGEIGVSLSTVKGKIKDFDLHGDYLENGDASGLLKGLLENVEFDKTEVLKKLKTIKIEEIIPSFNETLLLDLIF